MTDVQPAERVTGADSTAEIEALRAEVADLRRALESHPMIDQAQGMLMMRFDIDPPRSFALLKRVSQDNNVKLRDIAAAIVATAGAARRDGVALGGLDPDLEPTARILALQLLDPRLSGPPA